MPLGIAQMATIRSSCSSDIVSGFGDEGAGCNLQVNLDVSTRLTTAPYKVSALACFEFYELFLTTFTYKSEI